ncbi:hypothetical protein ACFE04_012477 [Oxalis oulophora]
MTNNKYYMNVFCNLQFINLLGAATLATIAPPVKGNMFKALCICYAVIVSPYFCVAFSGPKNGPILYLQYHSTAHLSVPISNHRHILRCAILPFFGDIMAFFGVFGFNPLDFILPMVLYNAAFKPSKRSLVCWGNTHIAMISAVLVAAGVVASVRQMVLNAKSYNLFANI